MENDKLVKEFYDVVSKDFGREITAGTTLKELNMTSSDCFMIIADMEDLGAVDVTFGMLRKCGNFGEAAALMLENLE